MADAKRVKRVKHLSPLLTARYPHILTADTKFKADGEFHLVGILTASEAQAIIAVCEPVMAEAEAMAAAGAAEIADKARKGGKKVTASAATAVAFYGEVIDPDTGDETGELSFKFASNATWKDMKTGAINKRVIPIFSSAAVELKGKDRPEAIWGGSKLRILFTAAPYYMPSTNSYGVKRYLEAVKVIDLVGGGGMSNSDMGGAEDGWAPEATAEGPMGGNEAVTGTIADDDF